MFLILNYGLFGGFFGVFFGSFCFLDSFLKYECGKEQLISGGTQ